jgi:excisionase family DNA binding protein
MQESATSMQSKKIAYSVRELSELVGICERKIHYEIEKGKLKIARIGRRVLIRASEVDRWLSEAEG